MTSELLKRWLTAMVESMPRGGRSRASRQLGMTASGFSKLLNDDVRQFDDKTIRCMLWMQQAKAERFPKEKFPLQQKIIRDGLVIESRLNPSDGSTFCVWRVA